MKGRSEKNSRSKNELFPPQLSSLLSPVPRNFQPKKFQRLSDDDLMRAWWAYSWFPDLTVCESAGILGWSRGRMEKIVSLFGWPSKKELRSQSTGINRNAAPGADLPGNAQKQVGGCQGGGGVSDRSTTATPRGENTVAPTTDFLITLAKKEIEKKIAGSDLSELSSSLTALVRTAEATKGRLTESGKSYAEICQEVRRRKLARIARKKKDLDAKKKSDIPSSNSGENVV